MTRLPALAGFIAVLATAPAGAAPQIDELRSDDGKHVALVDRSGKGAVLCSWSLLVLAQEVGRQCPALRDRTLQPELDRSVGRIEAFILKNSARPPSRADLARWREQVTTYDAPGGLCAGEPGVLYAEVGKGGAAHLRSTTDDLLSVPREPVMNPCL
jgi:hypothetical protein